jgi:hypothetical protein
MKLRVDYFFYLFQLCLVRKKIQIILINKKTFFIYFIMLVLWNRERPKCKKKEFDCDRAMFQRLRYYEPKYLVQ